MKDIAKCFAENPLLSLPVLQPSGEGLQITCLLNPGVFQYEGKTWLIVKGAERHRTKRKYHLVSYTDGSRRH